MCSTKQKETGSTTQLLPLAEAIPGQLRCRIQPLTSPSLLSLICRAIHTGFLQLPALFLFKNPNFIVAAQLRRGWRWQPCTFFSFLGTLSAWQSIRFNTQDPFSLLPCGIPDGFFMQGLDPAAPSGNSCRRWLGFAVSNRI